MKPAHRSGFFVLDFSLFWVYNDIIRMTKESFTGENTGVYKP